MIRENAYTYFYKNKWMLKKNNQWSFIHSTILKALNKLSPLILESNSWDT